MKKVRLVKTGRLPNGDWSYRIDEKNWFFGWCLYRSYLSLEDAEKIIDDLVQLGRGVHVIKEVQVQRIKAIGRFVPGGLSPTSTRG